MRLGEPLAIFWLLCLLLLLAAWLKRQQWAQGNLKKFARANLLAKILPGSDLASFVYSSIFYFLIVIFLVFTLMKPQWGTQEIEIKQRGIEMLVMVDVSQSMLAQDLKPSRLEHVRRKFKDLVMMLEGDRVGLVLFAGRSILQCPFTNDYVALDMLMDEISTESVSLQGTDYPNAFNLAMRIFSKEDNVQKVILMMTDGEDHSEGLDATLAKLKEQNIRLYILGIGSEAGAPIPLPAGGFKQDGQGNLIVSKLGENTLKNMSLATSGAYVRSIVSNADLKEIYENGIRRTFAKQEFKGGRKLIWIERYYFPLGIACLLMILERLLIYVRRYQKIIQTMACFVLLLFSSFSVQANPGKWLKEYQGQQDYLAERFGEAVKKFSDVAQSKQAMDTYYNLGLSQYQLKNYEAAKKSFEMASKSSDLQLKEQALYNLGNTHYRQEKLEEAIKAYEQALQIQKEDPEAKLNLEFVKKKLQEKQQQQQQDQQNQEEKNQQGQQEQDQQNQQQQQAGQQSQDNKNQDKGEKGEQQKQDQQDQQKPQNQQGQQQEKQQQHQQQNEQQAKQDAGQQKQDQNKKPPEQEEQKQAQADLSGDIQAKQNQDNENEQKSKPNLPMSPEEMVKGQEAERWLNMVEDHASEILNAQLNQNAKLKPQAKDW